uniref:Uncharacterized protein n=1 Tax=Bos indicus x Bos taurus TaxID=30522 RepID=A0A4W2IMS2_BOBOX
ATLLSRVYRPLALRLPVIPEKSADSRVPASFAEPREPAASRRCHCARIQGQSSSAGWRLLSGTVRFVVTSMETERPTKAATAHLPRSWEVRNRYTEEGGQTSQVLMPPRCAVPLLCSQDTSLVLL